MKTLEIQYTRKMTFNKTVEVEDALADRLLALDGESSIDQLTHIVFDEDGCNCDFTTIAESLTDAHDIIDGESEIEDISIEEKHTKE